MKDTNTRPNPYVGPRAFLTGEQLYGRDRELRELLNFLLSQRIVLLYSPSGAGKTSLVQAGLIPALAEKGFSILPIIRVNQEPPSLEGIGPGSDSGSPPVLNRYIYSALLSLEEGVPEEKLIHAKTLANINLEDYLRQRPGQNDASETGQPRVEVLVFDQFEEILTINPSDQASKAAFFSQVGDALLHRHRWALFSMREDYIAALDPYLRLLPTHLRSRYRLDLLGADSALQAIQRPASQAGATFSDPAAAKLVNDLREVQVQRPDGSLESQPGPYVEPVQLQVVCKRLWENLDADDNEISEEDVAKIGDVNQSLSEYYGEELASIAAQAAQSEHAQPERIERAIREWFERKLITEQGFRSQVLMGPERSEGLENQTIRRLVDAFLVRAEKRRGATWFELAHDRLIEPVRRSNVAWFQAHLSPLQRQAALWEEESRPDRLLLLGPELAKAQAWAEAHSQELNQNDREFLVASQQAHAEEERLRAEQIFRLETAQKLAQAEKLRAEEQSHSARRLRRALVVALLFLGLFLGVAGVAFYLNTQVSEKNAQLQKQLDTSKSSQLAAQSEALLLTYPQKSLLLSAEAAKLPGFGGFPELASVRQGIYDALANAGGQVLRGHMDELRVTGISPDGCLLATAGVSRTASTPALNVWDVCAPDPGASAQPLLTGITINALAFAPQGRWLAAGDENGGVYLFDLLASDLASGRLDLKEHQETIDALVFSPSGRWLATGGRDHQAILWDLFSLEENPTGELSPSYILLHKGDIDALAFSPDERWLATGSTKAEIILWDLTSEDPAQSGISLPVKEGQILALAFSPDGSWLAAGGSVGGRGPLPILLFDVEGDPTASEPLQLNGHTAEVRTLAFRPDGNWLASGSLDHTARLWNLKQLQPVPIVTVLRGHEGGVLDLGFSQDAEHRYLVTISTDNTARVWDLASADPGSASVVLRGHEGSIRDLAFSAQGDLLATVSTDQMARLWDINSSSSATVPFTLRGPVNDVREVVVSSDSQWLFSAERNGGVRVWDLSSGYPEALGDMLVDPTGDDIRLLALAPGGKWLFGAGGSGNVLGWQLTATGPNPQPIVMPGPGGRLTSLAVSQNEARLAAGGRSENIMVWDLTQSDLPSSAVTLPGHQGDETLLALSPRAEWLATAGDDGRLQLYDLDADDVAGSRQELLSSTEPLSALTFSPGGKWLAAAGGQKGSQVNCVACWVHVWEITSNGSLGEHLELEGHSSQVRALAFNVDENKLGSGDFSGEVRLWRFDNVDNPYLSIKVHNREINDLVFTPDGRWLISGGADNTLRMWDTDSANPAANAVKLPGSLKIWALSVSEDGRWLAAGASDGLLRLWPLGFEQLISLACQTAGRNLEPIERQQYLGENPLYSDPTCEQWPMTYPATPEP